MNGESGLSKTLKFKTHEVRFGYARVSGVVEDGFLNSKGIGHGGYLFSIADFAAGRTTNVDGRAALTSHASINFVAPCPAGTTVFAVAKVSYSDEKTAVCDTVVSNSDGSIIYAVFQSRMIFRK